jgi:type IV secretory pathway VirB3-like protein
MKKIYMRKHFSTLIKIGYVTMITALLAVIMNDITVSLIALTITLIIVLIIANTHNRSNSNG